MARRRKRQPRPKSPGLPTRAAAGTPSQAPFTIAADAAQFGIALALGFSAEERDLLAPLDPESEEARARALWEELFPASTTLAVDASLSGIAPALATPAVVKGLSGFSPAMRTPAAVADHFGAAPALATPAVVEGLSGVSPAMSTLAAFADHFGAAPDPSASTGALTHAMEETRSSATHQGTRAHSPLAARGSVIEQARHLSFRELDVPGTPHRPLRLNLDVPFSAPPRTLALALAMSPIRTTARHEELGITVAV
ncbi:hypothetical protein BU16DRAFT_566823 [Lophium mytilinum]|uniref:Uncharacterized protein n=1 Tax=Lophium mytilinum TaxID=390894 RepID=A0A6A6QBS3_9PEZI|nr:hypothetical protein BU16DRAFT_566823 [Lophium mytilinum]